MNKKPKNKEEVENGEISEDINEILKEYKKEILSEGCSPPPKEKITTSSFFLDAVMGGGFSVGSWSNVWGGEESGKTSMGLTWGRNWQQAFPENGYVIFFNAEGRLTAELIKRSGINCDPQKFQRIDTNQSEAIYGISERIIRLKKYNCFIIIDSLDAIELKEDSLKTLELSGYMTAGARINSMAGRRLSILIHTGPHHLFVCSQLRDKVNSPVPVIQQSGGHAIKHYSSLRGILRRKEHIYASPSDKSSEIIGRILEIKFDKTPDEKSGRKIEIPIKHGLEGGVWKAYEAMIIAQQPDLGIYKKESGSYQFKLDPQWQEDLKKNNIEFKEVLSGERNFRDYFDSNPKLVDYILAKARVLIT